MTRYDGRKPGAVRFEFVEELAVDDNLIDRDVDGERLAAGIGDLAALGTDDFALCRVVCGQLGEFLVLRDLQVDETRRVNAQHEGQREADDPGPAVGQTVHGYTSPTSSRSTGWAASAVVCTRSLLRRLS